MYEGLPQEIIQFLSYKETVQNRSPLTVAEYASDLRTFFRYLKAKRNKLKMEEVDELSIDDIGRDFIAGVTETEIFEFLLYLAYDRKNNPRTRARKLSSLRSFFKYHTHKTRLLDKDPAEYIDTPQFHTMLPKYLSLDESIDLIDSVSKTSHSYARDHAILTLFLNCGMRLSELVGINLSDIASDMSKLVVTGKGAKMRTIYLNTACRSALKDYLEVRQSSVNVRITEPNALFLSNRGKRISNKTVQWMVKKQLAQSGLGGKGYSTHKLRHTAATLMYNEGNVDVRALKDILGHEQLTTTQIYTHVSDQKLKDAMEANPLAKKK